jgi:hypothetical protein
MQSQNYNWEVNIECLLKHPKYKSISKLVASDNSWARLNYKTKENVITPNNSWDSIIEICDKMLE